MHKIISLLIFALFISGLIQLFWAMAGILGLIVFTIIVAFKKPDTTMDDKMEIHNFTFKALMKKLHEEPLTDLEKYFIEQSCGDGGYWPSDADLKYWKQHRA